MNKTENKKRNFRAALHFRKKHHHLIIMLSILSATLLVVGALAAVPNVPLYNAAQAGMTMPALG